MDFAQHASLVVYQPSFLSNHSQNVAFCLSFKQTHLLIVRCCVFSTGFMAQGAPCKKDGYIRSQESCSRKFPQNCIQASHIEYHSKPRSYQNKVSRCPDYDSDGSSFSSWSLNFHRYESQSRYIAPSPLGIHLASSSGICIRKSLGDHLV